MIISADGMSVYQLSEHSGQIDLLVWFILFVVWAVTTTRGKGPAAATPTEQQHADQLARRRFRRITGACAVIAILWPVLGAFAQYSACRTGAC
ncbi:hypothetical protein [Streptacidiphilus anmyonensis]|uniref:hypothetical protein n=1 Tax=Streptacidiphilus anmyonensis TaxID=405782 RepID=UPI00128D5900|nr:hypothetical protein [Streptacidiphilus anmyonensis]